jgi:nitrate/nitrite transporter NarK
VLAIVSMVLGTGTMTYGTLYNEIIPPEQRGRAGAVFQITVQLQVLLFWTFMIGRFDDRIVIGGVHVSGECMLYWSAVLFLIFAIIFYAFFVRERKPKKTLAGERVSLVGAVKGILWEKQLWPVYLLPFSGTFLAVGLGAIGPLLYTEQWGYSKQQFGTNVAIGGVINIVLSFIIGYFADKFDRIKIYLFSIIAAFVMKIVFYVFVQFFLPDHRPELWQIIVFGEMIAVFGLLTGVVSTPLLFDYIPRDKMGTATAGISIIGSITGLVTLNGVGLWVTWYSKLFCPSGQYDYFSAYIFMIIMGVIGIVLTFVFAHLVWSGKLKQVGRMDIEMADEGQKA